MKHNKMTQKNISKNPWLAGLIDGDGYFYNKNGYSGLEITVAYNESPLLTGIKQAYGGSIKNRCNSKSVRYRLHNQRGLTHLVHEINGYIRNSIRVNQFQSVLVALNVNFIPPYPFTYQNGYACGLFDSDGTVSLSVHQTECVQNITGIKGKIARLENASKTQLSISVTQKYKPNVFFLTFATGEKIFGSSTRLGISDFGSIYYDKSQNGYYKWYITSRKHIYIYLHYMSHFPSRNPAKTHRLRLIPIYYHLWDLKVYKSDVNSDLYKQWCVFAHDWFKYS